MAKDLLPQILQDPPQVVLCGSFRKDPTGLASAYRQLLAASCQIISPQSIDFVGEVTGFVFTKEQSGPAGPDPVAIEKRHLQSISLADFVWLHAPEGYIGPSASLELGSAYAQGIPVYSSSLITDPVLSGFVKLVPSPLHVTRLWKSGLIGDPGRALLALQVYYAREANRRQYGQESASETMLLFIEELGEFSRALRRSLGLTRHSPYPSGHSLAEELADLQLYLVHWANILEVDLGQAVTEKERINLQEFRDSQSNS